jgi:GrpB-like predicted nucleotidyltransferase (UPF0157 family)
MTKKHDPLVVCDYDVTWPNRFAKLAARAQTALGDIALSIEHVGSTAAVPGLAAKSIIDLDIVVPAQSDVLEAVYRLGAFGYVHEGNLGIHGREAFRCPPGEERHHLYVLVRGSAELSRHIAFRDALRADSTLRDGYAELKRFLAAKYPHDRVAYNQAKSAFIESVLD